jgi:NAD(P)-dependent dehydrogenase (short-subunit alcohol dehydrogenase family)
MTSTDRLAAAADRDPEEYPDQLRSATEDHLRINDFEGRVAFVTGGAQGIGLALAQALADLGARVAIADVNATALVAAEAKLAQVTEVVAAHLDVRDRQAYAAVADNVESRLGPVSLLFNNAGVAGSASPAKMSYESWDWVLGVNLGGVINGVQTFVPRMIARSDDCYVVNTASGAGLVAADSGFLYTTSKFAVVGMSESLHQELAHHRIGVSVLCPGPVATGIIKNTAALRTDGGVSSQRVASKLEAATALLDAGTSPDAVAQMVVDAMRAGRLHIHTHDTMAAPIQHRTQLLLAALPSALAASSRS